MSDTKCITTGTNELNRDCLPDLIAMMKRRGYRIVSLSEALKDSLYGSSDTFVAEKGISWIHRWGATKGMAVKMEPDPPQWVMEAYNQLQR